MAEQNPRFFNWHKAKYQREVDLTYGVADFVLTLNYLNRPKEIAIEVKWDDYHTALGQAISYLHNCSESWIAMPSIYCRNLIALRQNLPIRLFDTNKMKDYETESCPLCNTEECKVCEIKECMPAAKVYYINPIFVKRNQNQSATSGERVPWLGG
jgi:hypothetical protein